MSITRHSDEPHPPLALVVQFPNSFQLHFYRSILAYTKIPEMTCKAGDAFCALLVERAIDRFDFL